MSLWATAVGWILSFAAIVGNGLVIYLIVTRRRLHTIGNCFLVSLAVADMGIGGLYIWLFLASAGCLAQPGVCLMYFFVLVSSTLGLSAITMERWVAIASPLKYPTLLSRRRVVILICLTWTVPIVLILAPLAWIFVADEATAAAITKGFILFQLLVFDLCPCLLLIVATGKIIGIARRQSRQIATLLKQVSFNHPNDASAQRRQATRRPTDPSSALVIAVVVVLFAVCRLGGIPVAVCMLFRDFTYPQFLADFGRLLFVANSAFNPVAFSLFKRDVRAEAKRMFRLEPFITC